jgi:hypothetical protein
VNFPVSNLILIVRFELLTAAVVVVVVVVVVMLMMFWGLTP